MEYKYTQRPEFSRTSSGMDSHQQFCLKWNSFGSNLATAFSNLFKSESLADVTLFCEGQMFRAHKLILAACSKHFQELFDAAPPSHAGPCYVILEATTAANMAALLEFMYKGEVHVSQEALSSFLKSAESLQVKGLSIEQEKIAYAQSIQHSSERYNQRKSSTPASSAGGEAADSAPPPLLTSFAPILPPYSYGRGAYTPTSVHLPPHSPAPRRNHHSKSKHEPSPTPSPIVRNYRPGSSSSVCGSAGGDEPDTRSSPEAGGGEASSTNGLPRAASADTLDRSDQVAEDLSVKMESEYAGGTYSASSTPPAPTSPLASNATSPAASLVSHTPQNTPDIWSIKLASNKSGGIATADGKKLKCPFCERLYGYETNLRAHIRQRHQGIRVPCPFCTRTFTRNNTVRRHIAREHKQELPPKPELHHQPLHNHAQ